MNTAFGRIGFGSGFDFGDEGLVCPCCDNNYLHSAGVRIWDRGEDENPAQLIEFDNDRRTVKLSIRDQKENPSPRRHAIEIEFDCEQCGDKAATLQIVQHKGSTFMGWKRGQA